MSQFDPASPAGRAHAWLFDACFPFWAARARHPRGGFRERVALDGTPLDDPVSRVRVQARQTYVFARAALMGWEPDTARALVAHGLDALRGPCRRVDGLLGRMVRLGEGLEDPQPELYDNAFGVLAFAWAARALNSDAPLADAETILARLAETHAHPAGGYQESLPPRAPRRQNPHMHLFEAATALYEASAAPAHLALADAMLALFDTRFFDRARGVVREHFTPDWSPLDGPDGDVVEPGHGLEWVALLDRHAAAAERPAPIDTMRALYEGGLKTLGPDGFAPMALRRDGSALDPTRRTWSQTEALRAHLAMARAGDADAAARAHALYDAIERVHLAPAPAGGWIDHVDADGRRATEAITAATGYHLVTALADLMATPGLGGEPQPG